MNVTEVTTPVKYKEDFYSYRLDLQVQAHEEPSLSSVAPLVCILFIDCAFDNKRIWYKIVGAEKSLELERNPHLTISKIAKCVVLVDIPVLFFI